MENQFEDSLDIINDEGGTENQNLLELADVETSTSQNSKGLFPCHICHSQVDGYFNYISHIASEHYTDELRQFYDEGHSLRCKFCGQVSSSQQYLVTISYKLLFSLLTTRQRHKHLRK
jgi:hypothetical protein